MSTDGARMSKPHWEPVLPGIWRARLGEPEELTPVSLRRKGPDVEGLNHLPQGPAPFEAQDIVFNTHLGGCVAELPLKAGEDVYGFGLQLKSFVQTSKKKQIRPNADPKADSGDSHAPVPFYVTTGGYGLLVDTARYATFYCGSSKKKNPDYRKAPARREHIVTSEADLYDAVREAADKTMLIEIPAARGVDLYCFAGPDMLTAVRRYNLFSGSGCLPPPWGLGIWYRTYAKFALDQVLDLASELRKEHIPCDVLGLEPGWQSHSYSCSFKWDEERGKGHETFVKKTAQDGYHINLWEHAFVHPTAPFYEEIKDLCPDWEVWGGVIPDFADKEAEAIFKEWHRKELVDKGISGFKLDECDGSDFTGGWSFPNSTRFASGLDGEQMHSLFGLLYQDAINSLYEEKNLRTYNAVRNSHALAAPYPFVLYSDLYEHRDFIRGVVNMGFSGLLWTPEVRHAESPEDLIRRIQTLIFSPLVMINAWYIPLPPWKQLNRELNGLGEVMEGHEVLTAAVRKLFEVRMSLIPYLYSAFWAYKKEGRPPFRALVMDYPEDREVRTLQETFLMGDSLLVHPLTEGEKSKTVYLPGGAWYCFWTGKRYEAGYHTLEAGPDYIPVFVKEGSLLPYAEPVEYVTENTLFQITARIYGKAPASAVLFEDDGVTMDYEKGVYNTVSLSYDGDKAVLTRSGSFTKKRYELAGWKVID